MFSSKRTGRLFVRFHPNLTKKRVVEHFSSVLGAFGTGQSTICTFYTHAATTGQSPSTGSFVSGSGVTGRFVAVTAAESGPLGQFAVCTAVCSASSAEHLPKCDRSDSSESETDSDH